MGEDIFTHSFFPRTAEKPWEAESKPSTSSRKNKKAAKRILAVSSEFFSRILPYANADTVKSSISDVLRGTTPTGWTVEENCVALSNGWSASPRIIYYSEPPESACKQIEEFLQEVSPEEQSDDDDVESSPAREITWDLVRRKKFMEEFIGRFVVRETNKRDLSWSQRQRLSTLCHLVFTTKTVSESMVKIDSDGIFEVSLIAFDPIRQNYIFRDLPDKRKVARSRKTGGGKGDFLYDQWEKFLTGYGKVRARKI